LPGCVLKIGMERVCHFAVRVSSTSWWKPTLPGMGATGGQPAVGRQIPNIEVIGSGNLDFIVFRRICVNP